ncbi:helix-turn-helix transcriptional regulator [Chryseobacterium sp. SN22]|uniref:helix-turn-helix domain-containing protein n=1 Tax=Chryseobacterium sp. SN22 TaxID=2606431 RepID=UPI0011EBFF66|nr:helix-turn-helix transcriptional regulator [Chryseobacterium sp. SN22]KAA0128278.1 helix-turn-helix transcriptional regulator [Chryseobacterium sp. SN22]
MEQKVHQGRNVKRFREMLGIKQETLAFDLNISQQKISLEEQKEIIDKDLLEKIAAIMKIPVEAFQNFDEEAVINIISNTFNNHDHASPQFASVINNSPSFHPLDKMVELYERMLQQQKEMIEKLEQLLQNK